jgi:hypothetical protein
MVPFFDVISSFSTFFVPINAKISYFNPRAGGLGAFFHELRGTHQDDGAKTQTFARFSPAGAKTVAVFCY